MEKLTFAQKALQAIALQEEITKLRRIFDTPNEEIDTLIIEMCTPGDKIMSIGRPTIAHISDVQRLKDWINDYMPTLIAKHIALEDEINQHDAAINS